MPQEVKRHIEEGNLTAGHARSLIAVDKPAELATQIIKLGLSVRDAEKLSRTATEESAGRRKNGLARSDPNTRAVEQSLLEATGLKVEIKENGRGSGRLVIHYKTLEQLEAMCLRLRRQ